MAGSFKQFITNVVIPIVFVLSILLSLPLVAGHGHDHGHGHAHDHGHGHAHDHGHGHAHNHHGHAHDHHGHSHDEPPSFKYSKQANEAVKAKVNTPKPSQDHGHAHNGHGHAHGHQEEAHTAQPPQPKSGVWLEAIGATLIISIAPYIILFFVPVTNKKEHKPYLKVLLAFASGGLLGDAFLHLIPHASSPHSSGGDESHSHGHSHGGEGGHSHDTSIGLAVLGGIIAFLVIEKLVRIFKAGHSHSHSHSAPAVKASVDDAKKKKDDDHNADEDDSEEKEEKEDKEVAVVEEGEIKVAGYLNLAADFTHNFTDGLAIGASFLAGKNVGIITTITIFLHEIPHEIGDFAILLQSGCSRQKAMKLQLVTALGALTGCVVSLLAEGADESAILWILPFTAGGFIYIATVSVIPELLENTTFKQSVAEVLALLTGVALMIGITQVEEMGHEH